MIQVTRRRACRRVRRIKRIRACVETRLFYESPTNDSPNTLLGSPTNNSPTASCHLSHLHDVATNTCHLSHLYETEIYLQDGKTRHSQKLLRLCELAFSASQACTHCIRERCLRGMELCTSPGCIRRPNHRSTCGTRIFSLHCCTLPIRVLFAPTLLGTHRTKGLLCRKWKWNT